MTGKKSLMNAIKRAVSPNPQRARLDNTSTAGPCTTPTVSRTTRTPLTDFICSCLQGEKLQLFGLILAEAVKNDRHAQKSLSLRTSTSSSASDNLRRLFQTFRCPTETSPPRERFLQAHEAHQKTNI